jgi:hypothetical protein
LLAMRIPSASSLVFVVLDTITSPTSTVFEQRPELPFSRVGVVHKTKEKPSCYHTFPENSSFPRSSEISR